MFQLYFSRQRFDGVSADCDEGALRPFSLTFRRCLGGGLKTGGVQLATRKMQGAFGKTSGRSIFPNAPLRATSSALSRSMSRANRNALSVHIVETRKRVGFAEGRKLLRWFGEQNLLIGAATLRNQCGICYKPIFRKSENRGEVGRPESFSAII